MCPICGDELNRLHILAECRGLAMERRILGRAVSGDKLTDLQWLARLREQPVSTFLALVQYRFFSAGDLEIRSTDVRRISSGG